MNDLQTHAESLGRCESYKEFGDKLKRQRPYCVECTGSLPNSEVKPRKARIVLGWVTAREVLRVLLTFLRLRFDQSGWKRVNRTARPEKFNQRTNRPAIMVTVAN